MMQSVKNPAAASVMNDCVALKDAGLVYRACSTAYAQSLGCSSPDEVIGRTDLDLLPEIVAREQMNLDEQTLMSAKADISTIRLGDSANQANVTAAMIVRTPVLSEGDVVRGIDIRLVGSPTIGQRRSAITVDYELLVKEGLQGSLIINDQEILFANDAAANTLGYDTVAHLQSSAKIDDLFTREQLMHLKRAAISEVTEPERTTRARVTARRKDGFGVRLITRAALVNWGSSQATLLSFIDMGPAADRTFQQQPGVVPVPSPGQADESLYRIPSRQVIRLRPPLQMLLRSKPMRNVFMILFKLPPIVIGSWMSDWCFVWSPNSQRRYLVSPKTN